MSDYLAARRYARALSAAITSSAELDPALEWLRDFSALIEGDAAFRDAVTNPINPISERLGVLDEVLRAMNAGELLTRFAKTVLQRGRIEHIGAITRVFRRHVDDRLNRTTALVTTAHELDTAQENEIKSALAAYSGKEVRLVKAIDETIIGGVVAKLEGSVIDGSLRARLNQLRASLLSEDNGTS